MGRANSGRDDARTQPGDVLPDAAGTEPPSPTNGPSRGELAPAEHAPGEHGVGEHGVGGSGNSGGGPGDRSSSRPRADDDLPSGIGTAAPGVSTGGKRTSGGSGGRRSDAAGTGSFQSDDLEKTAVSEHGPAAQRPSLTQISFSDASWSTGSQSIVIDLENRVLGDFRLLRRLGAGGMAEVFLAEQISLKRQVAVKVLQAGAVIDPSYVARFQREATAAAALNHPNIVQVYAVGEVDGIHYIAQEFVRGMNLREFLNRKGPPPIPIAVRIMKQVASALQAAADAGIVHRDIKPENILLTPKLQVKVADFGLAKVQHESDRMNLTQAGTTMGTPLYMSPEQVSGKPLDQRSDIYSFGVTCYHLLAGRPPFTGHTAVSIAVQHLHETAVPLTHWRPDIPDALAAIVERMMQKSPADRFPNARAVLDALKQAEKEFKSAANAGGEGLSRSGRRSTERRRRHAFWEKLGFRPRTLRWFAASLVLTAVLAGIAGARRGDRNPFTKPPPVQTRIPKQNSALEQYVLAMNQVDNEEAWRAVIEYFPDAFLERRSAEIQLALLYLRSGRSADAAKYFAEFAKKRDEDPSLAAIGFAGQAVIATQQGRYQDSQRIIDVELRPVRQFLNLQLRRLIEAAIERNQQALGQKVEEQYRNFFDTPAPDQPRLPEDAASAVTPLPGRP